MQTLLVSFLIDVTPDDVEAARLSVDSLRDQTAGAWEALLTGAGADADGVARADDAHVRIVDTTADDVGERVGAGLAEASGEFVVSLPAGTALGETVVADLMAVADARSDVDVFYTDEARLGDDGWVTDLKPAWSPERFRSVCYFGPCAGVRTAVAREVGGFRSGLGGAHTYDLLLRAVERARAVMRVPTTVRAATSADVPPGPHLVGERRRDPALDATSPGTDSDRLAMWDAHVRVGQEHLDRMMTGATVERGALFGTTRVRRNVDPGTTVTAIVATRGERGLAWGEQRYYVVGALSSLLEQAGDVQLEVVVGLDEDSDPRVQVELAELSRRHGVPLRVEVVPALFHTAQTINHAVSRSDGEYLLVLEDRVEVSSAGFVTELLGPLADADLGIAGPRVVTSAGLHLGAGIGCYADRFHPMYEGRPETEPGRNGELTFPREVSALLPTGWAATRAHFLHVGGLAEQFQVGGHIDLAHKLRRDGLRRLWVPSARLVSFPPPVVGEPSAVWRVNELERRALAVRWEAPDLDAYAPHMGQRRLDRMLARERDIA